MTDTSQGEVSHTRAEEAEEGCDLQSAMHGLQQCLHLGNKQMP